MDAINHGDGMKGCAAELYEVDLQCAQAKLWMTVSRKKDTEGGLAVFGKFSNMKYVHSESDVNYFMAESYGYKYSRPRKWKFELGASSMVREKRGTKVVGEEEDNYDLDMYISYDGDVTDEDDDVPLQSSIVRRQVMFCGSMTGVRLLKSGFVKRAVLLMKDAQSLSMPDGRVHNER